MDLDTWACPVCYSRLSEHAGEVACGTEGRRYRQAGGLPVLVRPEQEDLLREAEHYASAWKRTKWAVPRDVILLLPYIKCHGWKQKAKSFRELQGILGSPRERRVVDVGAGTGWMSSSGGWLPMFRHGHFLRFGRRAGRGDAVRPDATPV